MATTVDICNMALARAEVSAFINALTDDTPEARAASVLFTQHRDTLLTMAAWPFAAKRVRLAVVAGEERYGWFYVYAKPADCLAVRDLNPKAPFEIEGSYILTNAEDAELTYTTQVVGTATLPPLFADALGWLLAADFAVVLGKSLELEQRARQRFELALSRAMAQLIGARRNKPEPDGEFIQARGRD